MNKGLIIFFIVVVAVAAAVISVAGVVIYLNSQSEPDIPNNPDINLTMNTTKREDNFIGKNKAISIMKGSSPDGAPGATATLTTFKGKPMYKVSWENGNYAYVDAVTGTVYDRYGSTGGIP